MGKKKMYFDVQRLAVIYIWKKLNHFDAITNIIADLVCSDAEFLCFFNTLEQFAYATWQQIMLCHMVASSMVNCYGNHL